MSVSHQRFKLRYPKDSYTYEAVRAILLHGNNSFRWEVVFEQSEEERLEFLDDATNLTVYKPDGSQIDINGTLGIESYLVNCGDLAKTLDPVQISHQLQLRQEIRVLLEKGVKVKNCADDNRETIEREFELFAKKFVQTHQFVLWKNGWCGHYFGTKTTFVDLALTVSIKRLMIILAPINMKLYDIISPKGSPNLHTVVNRVAEALSKLQSFFKMFDDDLAECLKAIEDAAAKKAAEEEGANKDEKKVVEENGESEAEE
ncbi:hypothetical protein LPJ66_003549 [Kickxella alabastrina]|uniref:Uncharacterized protein n=1 Tax=Kickxella alabastrina TaxID=61397 RepID=A0ACC1IM02_9FUNG|nr:hypothetical protein LPJ66_003549 [Kickxella alabastrina]